MAKPKDVDVMLCRIRPATAAIATMGTAEEALEFVRDLAEVIDELHISIVPGEAERKAAVAAVGFVGRPMTSRFASMCHVCKERFPAGADVLYNRELRRAAHNACGEVEA